MKARILYFLGLLFAAGLFVGSFSPARAIDVGISVGIAPPLLPVVVQPACPGVGYIWTPGYWAWDAGLDDYYWVPGVWVLSPGYGLLWTPAWWGCENGFYFFHSGYWGRECGFYGGINYGYGYFGRGFDGGYWRGNHFFVNRSVNNIGALPASRTFSRSVGAAGLNGSRTSFNGPGGTSARATAAELRAGRGNQIAATSAQRAQVNAARSDPAQRFSSNHGTPAVTGTTRAGALHANAAGGAANAAQRTTAAQTQRSATMANERATRSAGGNAFTGESRTAVSERAARSSTQSAFTGESRAATTARAQSHVANTSQRATRGASAQSGFTGERSVSHTAPASQHVARSSAVQHQAAFSAQHRSAPTQSRTFQSHAAMSRPSAPHYGGVSHGYSGGGHASAPAYHGGGGGGGAVHASAGGHASGGGGHASGNRGR